MMDDPLVRKYLFCAPYGCAFKAKIKGGYFNQIIAPRGYGWNRNGRTRKQNSLYYRYAKIMRMVKL